MGKILGILTKSKQSIFEGTNNSDQKIVCKNVFVSYKGERKFESDSIFYEDNEFIIVTEGVILNLNQLKESLQKPDLKSYIIEKYNRTGNLFFEDFKGSFCGFFYDKNKKKAIVYTNHFGDKQLFFHQSDDFFIFGSDIKEITNHLSHFSLSEKGAYSLLTYGFMLDDLTLVDEVKKLEAGHFLIMDQNNLAIQKYWDFDNTRYTKDNQEQIIENIDLLFRNAVRLEFEKDLEYNFKHLSTLSAGLDSRMNVWLAHDLRFKNQTNFTFSTSGYLDNTIAQNIASALDNQFIFISITENQILENFEKISKINFGNCSISGNIHVYNSISNLNFSKFGLCHTGQLGDVVIGTYNKTPQHQPVQVLSGSFSNFLKDFAPLTTRLFLNNEHFIMHQRGFNGILQGNLVFQEYTEVSSPFMDKDLFEYCMSIPPELRFNHRIYLKWIKKKHPKAGNYIWEKIRAKPNSLALRYKQYHLPISNFWNIRSALLPRIIKLLSGKFPDIVNKNNMNPYQYWYNSNLDLQKEITAYFETEKQRVEKYPELLKNITKMFYEGTFIEKSQVISLLSAIKYLWNK